MYLQIKVLPRGTGTWFDIRFWGDVFEGEDILRQQDSIAGGKLAHET
jgi:hypothetical protein